MNPRFAPFTALMSLFVAAITPPPPHPRFGDFRGIFFD